MKELATDIAIVIGPASVVYYLIGDPWASVLWSILGLSVRWSGKNRHRAKAMKEVDRRGNGKP
jgi:hypothetical protein